MGVMEYFMSRVVVQNHATEISGILWEVDCQKHDQAGTVSFKSQNWFPIYSL